MKTRFIILVLILFFQVSIAQNKISGKITDQNNVEMAGVSIYIPDLNKGTISNNSGHYELTNLPNGKIKILYSSVGYNNQIATIELTGKSDLLNITLYQTPVEMEAIVISGGYNSTQHENAVKIDILKLNQLTNASTPNFTESLTKVPGVDMISKGNGVSKPVIRGLSMNDILVLNNGVRFENYQYSSHHPLGIDEYGIETVEIIKGPASLLYGSDAIGGVINFIKEKPAPINHISGDYNLQMYTNSFGVTNNMGIKASAKKFFGGIRIGQKTNADYLQGGGEFVPNSRFNEYSIKVSAGFTDKIGTFKLFYDYSKQKLGLVEDEALEQISERGRKNEVFFQEFNTHMISSQNKLYAGKYKIEFNSAYQNTELIHFAEENTYEIQMKLGTLTYDAKLYLPSDKNSEFIIGLQGFNQINTNLNDRETILLPDATTNNYSAFSLVQFTLFNKLKLQSGIRYDYKVTETQAVGIESDTLDYRPALNNNYGSFSGSLGGTLKVSEKLLLRTNFAAAYRTPNLAELTSNGQHELRYEIGDAGLVPENAYETDLSLHYHIDNFSFDIGGFYNIVDNYIYIAPTGDSTTSGVSIYKYKQAYSFLFGGEAGLHIHPNAIKWLHFETTFSTVTGKQKSGDYLPFIPANKLRLELQGEKAEFLFLKDAFANINASVAFDQNNASPDESPTTSYTLVDLSIGGNIKMKNQFISISIGATNIFDLKYIDHLSTLKEVNFYNPGRNISLNLKVPFGA